MNFGFRRKTLQMEAESSLEKELTVTINMNYFAPLSFNYRHSPGGMH